MLHSAQVLIGPASDSASIPLASALSAVSSVSTITSRYSFRREFLRQQPMVVVLFETDDDGVPNDPLVRYCLERSPRCWVIAVSTGTRMGSAALHHRGERLVRYILPADGDEPLPLARLVAQMVSVEATGMGHGLALESLHRPLD